MRKKKYYTIVGFYESTMQRFADTVQAPNPEDAEDSAKNEHPDLRVCGVFDGVVLAVDKRAHVR